MQAQCWNLRARCPKFWGRGNGAVNSFARQVAKGRKGVGPSDKSLAMLWASKT